MLSPYELIGRYAAWEVRRETAQSIRVLSPWVAGLDGLLDVGCGAGHVVDGLRSAVAGLMAATDIVDCRATHQTPFVPFDGLRLPFGDGAFDVVLLSFVLHHVPNPDKAALLAETRRVARRRVCVLEDQPSTAFDRAQLRNHAERYRAEISSTADYGFYKPEEWRGVFTNAGLRVCETRSIGRLERGPSQPWPRMAFLLEPSAG
jgi:SAM-dependent methyltransferase